MSSLSLISLLWSERKAATHLPLANLFLTTVFKGTVYLGLFVCFLSRFCLWGTLYLTNSRNDVRCRLQIFGSWLQFRCICFDCCFGGPYPLSVAFHIFIQLAWRLPTVARGNRLVWLVSHSCLPCTHLTTMVVRGPFPPILYAASCDSCKMLLSVPKSVGSPYPDILTWLCNK